MDNVLYLDNLKEPEELLEWMENMTISLIVKATRLPKEKVEKIRAEMIKNGQLEENE